MIYTGYFAKTKDYEAAGLFPVGVAGKTPDFFKNMVWRDVAPRWDHFRRWKSGEIDDFQYTELYRSMLNKLDKEDVKHFIQELFQISDDIIFLCYEKPGTFCHRHILADWLESEVGVGPVDEYKLEV